MTRHIPRRQLVPWKRDDSHKSRAGHPGWRRCSSVPYAQYAPSSRLAIRAPRSGTYATHHASRGLVVVLALAAVALEARLAPAQPAPGARPQTQADDYTSYELLAPDSAQFRILYDVTATTAGARYFFNPIRKGSEATDERVVDLSSGEPLKFEVVSGEQARNEGHPAADLDTSYIKVWLRRPVPERGEARLRIDKTYKDAKSYHRDGDLVVFDRPLGIKRNKIVLPPGFELIAVNVPSQVFTEEDGRVAVSFVNTNPEAAQLVVKARPLPAGAASRSNSAARAAPAPALKAVVGPAPAPEPAPSTEASARIAIADRAFQDREIVYFLQPPDTHAFDLYHDYTERRPGWDKYVNVVRAGSTVANPSAINLDSGEALVVETLKGDAIARAKIDIGEPVVASSEAVVIRFPAVVAGQSIRLRISETYTDANRYGLAGDTLIWHRRFGRPRNTVVLPAGWYVTASAVPAVVSLAEDGRVQLEFVNPRLDEIDVLIKARRRASN